MEHHWEENDRGELRCKNCSNYVDEPHVEVHGKCKGQQVLPGFDEPKREPLPFVRESATSRAAAESMLIRAPTDEGSVWRYLLWEAERGATDDEIEIQLDLLHQTASARRRGLVRKKVVVDSGMTRKTRSGRSAIVWVTWGNLSRKLAE